MESYERRFDGVPTCEQIDRISDACLLSMYCCEKENHFYQPNVSYAFVMHVK